MSTQHSTVEPLSRDALIASIVSQTIRQHQNKPYDFVLDTILNGLPKLSTACESALSAEILRQMKSQRGV
jgi:hypothetical protein